MIKWFTLLFLLNVLPICSVARLQNGREQEFFFKTISTDEGLPQSSVNDILKDTRGFVWIATEDGLCRFDGSEFIVHRNIPDDSTSISHNVIHFIEEEEATGNLWVGTVSGLCYFNRSLESFRIYHTPNIPGTIYANAAFDKKRERLWLAGSVGGLQYLDVKTQAVRKLINKDLENEIVWTVKLLGDKLFVGTLRGLIILNLNNLQVSANYNSLPVRSIWVEGDDIWVGTEGQGLIYLNSRTGERLLYSKENHRLNNNNVWSLSKDTMGNLWIGTDGGGLSILSTDGKLTTHRYSESNKHSLSSNTIRSIFIEPNGNAWLGTYNGGVCYYEASPVQFQFYGSEFFRENSLMNSSVSAFAESPDGGIWVGTDGGGLYYFDKNKAHVNQYIFPAALKDINVITSLYCDDSGLWIGTYQNGLLFLDRKGKWKQFRNDPQKRGSISNNIVWSIQKQADQYLWIGTDNGLNKFNLRSEEFFNFNNPATDDNEKLFKNNQVQTLRITSDGTLWIGSYGTLKSYHLSTHTLNEIESRDSNGRSIPDFRVKALLEDEGKLWIGTYGNGLCQYDFVNDSFHIIDERDGLPDNVVLSIEKGGPGILWLATNKGLVQFSQKDSVFTTFDTNYGVQGTIFNRNASVRTRDGQLLFGGTRGFNVFTSKKIEPKTLPVIFTDFLIFNKRQKPGKGILSKSITETKAIDLSYTSSRMITIQFSALEFLNPDQLIYEYRLEGFNDQWQVTGNDHSATFTNLDPGSYRFQVRSSFNGRQWGLSRELLIKISAPWWRTGLFKSTVVIFLCLGGYSISRYRLYQLKGRKKELERLIQAQSREISRQNQDLVSQNEEFKAQNEELVAQRELITHQNIQLEKVKKSLLEMNESLESLVHQRTEKLNHTIHLLNKSIKELDAFVYSASHDLAAPLKSVMGLINLIRTENQQEDIANYVNHIESSVRKLEEVIKTMVQYSQNSQFDTTVEQINVYVLLQTCWEELKKNPGVDHLQLEAHVEEDAVVTTDPVRLKIILSNLLNNSIKYKDKRKSCNKVIITFEQGRTLWKMSIWDNGIGIDKQYLSRVFDMFYRATDRSKGSGLGLYVVKEIVDRLYGDIYVDSEYGHWTKFTVVIPNDQMHVGKTL